MGKKGWSRGPFRPAVIQTQAEFKTCTPPEKPNGPAAEAILHFSDTSDATLYECQDVWWNAWHTFTEKGQDLSCVDYCGEDRDDSVCLPEHDLSDVDNEKV